MSVSNLPERPAFQSLDVASATDKPPISRLAIAALIAGLCSLLAAFSTILLPLSMLAGALGAVAVWKLSRNSEVGGIWLAQIGLTLAMASVIWSLSAQGGKQRYLYAEAAKNAKILLDTLAAGDKYAALELRLLESDRQLTGTDLEKYYLHLEGERADDANSFLNDELTKTVIASGPQADWQFSHGVEVVGSGRSISVTVEMVNRALLPKRQAIQVRLRRQVGLIATADEFDTTALWNVEELLLAK